MKKVVSLLILIVSFFSSTIFAQEKSIIDSLLLEQDQKVLKNKLHKLENGSESELSAAISYHLSKPNLAYHTIDSLKDIAQQKFPLGKIAFEMLHRKITNLKDEVAQDSIYIQAKKDFPNMDFNDVNRMIAYEAIVTNNFNRAKHYANMLTQLQSVAFITLRWADKDSIGAEQFSKSFIRDENLNRPGYDYLTAAYGSVLFKLGQEELALKFADLSLSSNTSTSLNYLNYYSTLLVKQNRYKNLLMLLEEAYIKGILTSELENKLFIAYRKLNPELNINSYSLSLKEKAKHLIKAEMAKRMLPGNNAPNFVLKDINGEKVSLSDFKGKTIVIDFWATWCQPCIAAFPAMQMALNSYSTNPNVKFLFIHTKERSANALEEAKAFLTGTKYNFDLYMDTKDEEGHNKVADVFGVTGIPAKYVIDRYGKIRFNIVGHMFKKDEVLAEEMRAMIEIASEM